MLDEYISFVISSIGGIAILSVFIGMLYMYRDVIEGIFKSIFFNVA